MRELVAWVRRATSAGELPVPVVAGLAHYQFATIHPYYDGNGRTARLLTTLLLHRGGYGLRGIYSLEEHYSRNLSAYYRALTVGESHNYYEGRAAAEVTGFLAYFLAGMAEAFVGVQAVAAAAAARGAPDQQPSLDALACTRATGVGFAEEAGDGHGGRDRGPPGLEPADGAGMVSAVGQRGCVGSPRRVAEKPFVSPWKSLCGVVREIVADRYLSDEAATRRYDAGDSTPRRI